MKRLISHFAGTCLAIILVSYCLPTAYASPFRDIADGDWHTDAIEYVATNGLMEGVGDGIFQPNQPLTRAQIVAILYRLDGSPKTEYIQQFQDVPEDAWYACAVSWAYQHDVVHGTSEKIFSPSAEITREQLAVIIANYIESTKIRIQEAEGTFLSQVKDCWSVSPFAESGVILVCDAGIMNPDSQYNFNPRNKVTRADAAVVFMRLKKSLSGERLTGMLIPNTEIDFSVFSQKEKDAQALEVAKQIAAVIPAEGKSDLERVQMAAHIVSYFSKFCTYTMSGKDYSTAYGVFVKGEYSCAGSTRALGLVLTCMGYQWKHINENQYTHQWCEVYMDDQIGFADGQTGLVGYGTDTSLEFANNPFISFIDPWPYILQ